MTLFMGREYLLVTIGTVLAEKEQRYLVKTNISKLFIDLWYGD